MTDQTIIERWDTHITNINSSIHTMWNFIIYQQFTNSEIDRLNKKINELTDENNIMKLKRALDCNDDPPAKKKFKKIVYSSNLLKNEYKAKYTKTKYNG